MRDIKDYLHLYLGQQCEVVEHFKPHNYAGGLEHHAGTKLHIDAILLAIVHQSNLKVKPILRPLSDMTEDESAESIKIGNADRFDTQNRVQVGAGLPTVFYYLLSRGFDLFGLIESGLAIDKSKTTA